MTWTNQDGLTACDLPRCSVRLHAVAWLRAGVRLARRDGCPRRCRRSRPRAASRWSLIPAGSFEMGSQHGRDDEKPVHKVSVDSFLMDKYRGDAGRVREARQEASAVRQSVALQGAGPAGGAGHLAAGGPLLQRPLAPGRAQAVLQRGHRRVRFRGGRLSAADRGGMGIRLPGRDRPPTTRSATRRGNSATSPGSPTIPARRRIPSARRSPIRGACTTCTATSPSGARTSTTRTTTRPARTRTRAARPTARNTSCAAARGNRRRTPCGRPYRLGETPRLLRRLPGPRRHWLPLRPQARRQKYSVRERVRPPVQPHRGAEPR